MKRSLALACATAAVAGSFSMGSQAELSANIGVTSDYVWRGVTQSGGDASVSGGIDYASESGFYAGTWVGSLGGGSEVDFYLGYGGEAGNVEYDVGYIYYMYPGSDPSIDFGEIYASVGISGFSLGAAYTVNNASANDDAQFDSGDLYVHAGYGGDLADDWSWGVTVGTYLFDADGNDILDEVTGLPTGMTEEFNYVHYQLDIGKSTEFGDFTFTVTDTDYDSEDQGALVADPQIVVSWGIGF